MITRTYLDGNEKTTPDGIKGLSQELFYDDELKGMFYRVDGGLEFSNDAYDYIYDIVFEQGICAQIEFLLSIGNDTLKTYFEGVIHIPDIDEINVSRGTVKTPIADNNLSSYVFNNRNVKAYINAAKTKSGLSGFTTTPRTGFEFFTPPAAPGTYAYTRNNVYTVYDCFDFLVNFMSDGQMTFASPFFGSGGDGEFVVCVSALHLSLNTDVHPYMSFYELFTNLDKIFNLSIYIDYSGANPQMIIDKTDELYTDTLLTTFSDVTDLTVNFDKELFFSSIDIGSEQTQEQGTSFAFPDANFLGFKKEKYYITGQCNMDRTLNLVNDFIIDSNAIQDMLDNQNDTYDETVVLIQSDLPTNDRATQNENVAGTGRVYNLAFNNYTKSLNYLGAIPNDLVLYISNDANGAQATKSPTYALSSGDIIHGTEIYDPAGNYSTVTGRFTCPAGASGAYSFTFSFTGLNYTGTLGSNAGSLKLQRYSSGAVLLQEITLNSFTHNIVVIGFGGFTGVFSLEPGDYVIPVGVAGLTSTTYFDTSTFTIDYIDVEGGTYQTYDSNDYKVMNVSFETPLTFDDFEDIKNNIVQKIKVVSGNNVFFGWVKSIKRNILTGMSKIILRTSNNKK